MECVIFPGLVGMRLLPAKNKANILEMDAFKTHYHESFFLRTNVYHVVLSSSELRFRLEQPFRNLNYFIFFIFLLIPLSLGSLHKSLMSSLNGNPGRWQILCRCRPTKWELWMLLPHPWKDTKLSSLMFSACRGKWKIRDVIWIINSSLKWKKILKYLDHWDFWVSVCPGVGGLSFK